MKQKIHRMSILVSLCGMLKLIRDDTLRSESTLLVISRDGSYNGGQFTHVFSDFLILVANRIKLQSINSSYL